MSRGKVGLVLGTLLTMWVAGVGAAPQINLGNLPAGKTVTVSYDVTVNNDTVGNEISSQATVTGANFANVLSDDPDTATLGDATVTTIDGAESSLELLASNPTPETTESVTFTATVSSDNAALPTPTGNVEFSVDGGGITSVPLDGSGQATYVQAFAVGSYNVTANYVGNAENKATSNNIAVVVNPGTTTTTITSVTPNVIRVGEMATINFNVNSSVAISPSGTVTVSDGTDACNASASAGTCSIQFTSFGQKSLVANFSSDNGELDDSSSSPVLLDVLEEGAPLLQDDMISVDEDRAITFSPLSNDQTEDGYDLSTFEFTTAPSSGTIEINRLSGEVTYRGVKDFNGSDQAQYRVSDNAGRESNTATINITVIPVNDAPIINSEPPLKVVEATNYEYQVAATDAEGQVLQFTAPTLPSWLQLSGSQLMGTPQVADIGLHNVTLEVSDGMESVEQSFVIQVVSVNSNDVALTQETSSIAPLTGENFVISYTVSNSGPTGASNVDLVAEISGSVNLSVTDSRCQITNQQLSCQLGSIDDDSETTVDLTITGNSIHDVYSYAQITLDDDEISDNNQSGLGVSVTQDTMNDKAYTVGEDEAVIALSGDVNNDGLNDVVLLQGFNSIGSVFINDGFYEFSKSSDVLGYETAAAAELADINNDGNLDLIVVTRDTEYTLIYAGDGTGVFKIWQTLSEVDSNDLALVDINDDDFVDMVVANKNSDEVYLNQNGVMQLSHQINNAHTTSVALGDADGDMLPDALFAMADGTIRYYSNAELVNSTSPGASYSQLNAGQASNISTIDINSDGLTEFVVALEIDQANPAEQPENKIYQWSGSLNLVQSFGSVDSEQVIVSDIDRDSDDDLFVRNKSGAHQIYLNQAGAMEVTPKLLINDSARNASWIFDETDTADLLMAEALAEGSAIYANQGGGEFGVAETDLALSYSANINSLTVDGVVNGTLIVTNNGPGSAQSVQLTAEISSGLNVIEFGSGAEGCSITETAMTCQLGSVVPGDRVEIPVRLLTVSTGEATLSAEVSSILQDLQPNNNSQQVTITVTPKRDGGGGQFGWMLLLLLAAIGLRRRW